jgi:hypothetical protein
MVPNAMQAVPAAGSAGQFDRLPAAFGRLRIRLEHLDRRQVRQASELQKRPTDPARQRDALLEVPPCLLELPCPDLGGAETDQRQGAQVLAQGGLRRVRDLGEGLQPPNFLGHCRHIATQRPPPLSSSAGSAIRTAV